MNATINLQQMNFFAFHGYYDEEQAIGNTFLVDLTLHLDLTQAALSDNLEDTLNYELVYNVVKREMEQPSRLLENASYRILQAIRSEFKQVNRAMVRLTKKNPPLGGEVGQVVVELEL